jgi:hypothetical protein
VGLVDVARTVLGAAGLPADTRMNGRDLGRVDPSASSVPQLAITDPWVGSAWFAARWQGHKRIDRPGATGVEWYELAADPKEQHPQVLPSEHRLQSARDRWTEAVAAHAGDQVEAPVRSIPDDEVQRLEALGYVDPTRSAPGPGGPAGSSPATRPGGRVPGKAPGMRRGPPGGAQPPPSGG